MSVAAFGGGGGAMMASGGGMGGMMPMAAPQMPQAGPDGGVPAAGGMPSAHPLGDPRMAEDVEASLGGDACLCLEFSGALVRAAAWDGSKKKVVVMEANAASLALNGNSDAVQKWLSLPTKNRAVEAKALEMMLHERSTSEIIAPGRLLGCSSSDKGACKSVARGEVKITSSKKEDDEDDEDAEWTWSPLALKLPQQQQQGSKKKVSRIQPEECCGLLCAKYRQRASQLAQKPVRRAWVVAPGHADVGWRMAATKALESIDCYATRMISTPLATAVGALNRGALQDDVKTILSVDVGAQGIDLALIEVTRTPERTLLRVIDLKGRFFLDGEEDEEELAEFLLMESLSHHNKCRRAAGNLEKEADVVDSGFVKRLAAMLKKAELELDQRCTCCLIRADSGPALKAARSAFNKIIVAEEEDAVRGAASLAASKRDLKGAKPGLRALDAAPRSVGVAPRLDEADPRHAPLSTVEVLFERATEIPNSTRRFYNSADKIETLAMATLSGRWRACGDAGDPFETVDELGDLVRADSATIEFSVDSCGIPTAQVLASTTPVSAAKAARVAKARKSRRFTYAALGFFFLAPIFYTLVHMRKRAVTRAKTIKALTDFYARAKPDKKDEAASIADKYEGYEELLFHRLEKQYPGHLVYRDNKKQEAPDAEQPTTEEDDEEDVQEL